jgi:hypothetical protein
MTGELLTVKDRKRTKETPAYTENDDSMPQLYWMKKRKSRIFGGI